MSLHSVPRTIQTSTKRVLTGGDIILVTPVAFTAVPGTRFKVFVQKNSLIDLMAEFAAGGTLAGSVGFDFQITDPQGTVSRLGQTLGLKTQLIVIAVADKLPWSLHEVLDNLAEGEHTIELVAIATAGNAIISAAAASCPLIVTMRQSCLIYPTPGIDT